MIPNARGWNMSQGLIEVSVFAIVFLGVWLIYDQGGGEEIPARKRGRVFQIEQYSPPVRAVLEYRNQQGAVNTFPVKIARTFYYPDGRVCLRGYYNPFGAKPRSFRVDNIISVATLDGQYIDRRLFLTEELKIPSHLLPKAPLRSVSLQPAA